MMRRRSRMAVPTLASFKVLRFRNTAINPKLEIVFIILLIKSKQEISKKSGMHSLLKAQNEFALFTLMGG